MLDAVFGSKAAKNVLLFMQNYGEGYGLDIARTFDLYPTSVNNQLKKLEGAGVLINRPIGRTNLYTWNLRNPLVKPLRALLQETLESLPEQELQAYYRQRRRPRKSGKPL